MNPYSYSRITDGFQMHLVETAAHWQRYAVNFPTAFPVSYAEYGVVRGEYYCPSHADNAPLAILIHGMGERGAVPCKYLANDLAKMGVASFIVYLVFHHSRMPQAIKDRFPHITPEEWFESYRISVTDVRQVIDWAESRKELRPGQVSLIGISYGGSISAIAMGLDRRVKAGVLVVSAGNSEKITRESWLLNRQYKPNKKEYQRNQEDYKKYLAEVAENGFENVAPPKKSYLTDPMTFSSYLRERPVLMINAIWDEMIPKVAARDMWEACNKPPIAWFPATHATIWLWYPLILKKISRFLEATFNGTGKTSE